MSFPFQKEAMQFAHWVNCVPPAAVRSVLTTPRPDFPHFVARWQHLAGLMERHPLPDNVPAAWALDQGPAMGSWLAANRSALPGAQPARVFAQEYRGGSGGYTRKFVVATYKSLWNR